jgi:hypothetical protein
VSLIGEQVLRNITDQLPSKAINLSVGFLLKHLKEQLNKTPGCYLFTAVSNSKKDEIQQRSLLPGNC